MKYVLGILMPMVAMAMLAAAQEPKANQDPKGKTASAKSGDAQPQPAEPAPVIKLTVRAISGQPQALRYQLLPDALSRTPGNAAPLWLRAGQAAAQHQPFMTEKEYHWTSLDTPLKELPRKEVHQFLDRYKVALETADLAAQRQRCDWDLPPLNAQEFQSLVLPEVQHFRQIANLLSLQARLQIVEGHFDKAIHTLQTGFTLGKHVGEGHALIHALVGLAITTIMAGRVEELLQEPSAPNLYWALTILQPDILDLRKPVQGEMGYLYSMFPPLRDADAKDLTPQQAQSLIDDAVLAATRLTGAKTPSSQERLMIAGQVALLYPEAKRALIAQGRTPAQVEAMPTVQVVAIHVQRQFNEMRDDLLKWTYVPYWQGRAGLERAEKRYGRSSSPRSIQGALIGLVVPAFLKTYDAYGRTQRTIAGLRCAEAIRLHAALHGGKLPQALSDITDVPLPLDPITGKGFDLLYRTVGDGAILEVPPPPGYGTPALGRHYQFSRAP
jgi:hypothetical protein